MECKSMTGFGRAETVNENYRISVEIKSVNSRYMDFNIKMPKRFNPLEIRIRNMAKKYISRGKVDLYISFDNFSEMGRSLHYNRELAKDYMDVFEKMSSDLSIENNIKTSFIASIPEIIVLSDKAEDDESLANQLFPALEESLEMFVDTRIREGENLRVDLLNKLDEMLEIVERIEERSPEIVDAYEKKIREKIDDLLENVSVDDNRIVQEVTIFSDKICTDEEIVRLKSHIKSMKERLIDGGVMGRELDFIAQEMNREANTTLSKANDIIIADDAISLKTLIEKIREQIQNIE